MRVSRAIGIGLGALALCGAAASGSAAAAHGPACKGGNLSGSFTAVPGGGSAGHIEYQLTVQNKSSHKCFVRGLPKVRLLDKHGHSLPSHVVSAGGTVRTVVLKPGESAIALARTVDIPTAGDRMSGPCQPAAFRVRVAPRPGGGKFVGPVTPPHSFCGKGRMDFHPFKHA